MKIETWKNNEVLRTESENIKRKELSEYLKLGEEMVKYVKNPENGSVWLAAPQIWVNKKLIAVSLMNSYDDEDFITMMMLNPKIIEYSKKSEVDKEWCLSLPGESWKVERAYAIKLEYFNHIFEKKLIVLKWLKSRIVQHEIDHLNWVLFTDKLVK